jgi:hypothetical protein
MTTPSGTPTNDDISRVAHAVWEAEGQPEGRDHEHWIRAKQLIEEGRAESEYPGSTASTEAPDHAPRPVQPGFDDAAPGMTPGMKADPGPEIGDEPGGRFAKQLDEAPEAAAEGARKVRKARK